MAKETPTASCRTGREVHVVGLGEEVGHLEERDERDATFLWKRYVFEEVDLLGSWGDTQRAVCPWRVSSHMARRGRLADGQAPCGCWRGRLADGQAPCWC